MRRQAAWLLLLVLAGCGSSAPGDSPDAVCRRQAYDDPAVKRLTIAGLQDSSPGGQTQFAYNLALRNATESCLRQKGIQVRGGVEPVRPQ
jgi:hypothetical protein